MYIWVVAIATEWCSKGISQGIHRFIYTRIVCTYTNHHYTLFICTYIAARMMSSFSVSCRTRGAQHQIWEQAHVLHVKIQFITFIIAIIIEVYL